MRRRGFTLIELLVVIAIIGILSSVVLASLNQARVKSRDAKRIADMHAIQVALELYANDNGHYPNSNALWTSFDSPTYSPNPIVSPNAATLTAALAPHLAGTPKDPTTATGDSGYLYRGDGTNYCILMWRLPENLNNFPASYIPPNRCTSWDSSGKCTSAGGTNAIYIGVGTYSTGC